MVRARDTEVIENTSSVIETTLQAIVLPVTLTLRQQALAAYGTRSQMKSDQGPIPQVSTPR